MQKNRVFSNNIERPNVDKFATFSAFTGVLSFNGPDIQSLIDIVKQQSFTEGFRKGVDSTYKQLDTAIRKEIDGYVLLNTRIAAFLKKEIEGKYSPDVFKLTEVRANFFKITSGLISMVFLIETDIEHELWFSSLLAGLERKIFEEEKMLAELMFINIKGKEMDKDLLECNYPYLPKAA